MTRMSDLHFTQFMILAVVSIIHQRQSVVVKAASCEVDFSEKMALCANQGLKSVPNDFIPDLLIFDLSSNLLTMLENGTFLRYPHLQYVSLTNNNISHIDSGAFMPLEQLYKLDISGNLFLPTLQSMFGSLIFSSFDASRCNLESFAGDILTAFRQKMWLHLSTNKLQNINWTCNAKGFQYVDLSYNRFRQISRNTFVLICYEIDQLDLSDNPIEFIEASTVAMLRAKKLSLRGTHLTKTQWSHFFLGIKWTMSIKDLDLYGNKLHTIQPGFFAPLKGKTLERLDITANGLNVVDNHAFSDLTGVSRLEVSNNNLQGVEPIHINGMTSLSSLVLDENKIINFNSQNGTWNLSLIELNLDGNLLRKINSSTFQGLTTLKKLNLRKNSKLQVIENDTFANVPRLEELDLSWTDILDLSSNSIHHLHFLRTLILNNRFRNVELIQPGNLGRETSSLEILNLVKTNLYHENIWDPMNNISSFSGLHSLRQLDLSNNLLFTLPVKLFSNLTNLQILILQVCSLMSLEAEIFRDLENLIDLDLRDNYLSTLPPGLFDQMGNLQYLALWHNELTYLDSHLFKDCPSLRSIMLSSNSLSGLNKSTFEPLSSLRSLYIASNPLVCNCDLKWFPGWLKGSIKLYDSLGTTCLDNPVTLKPFRGKQLITFNPGAKCGPDITLYSCLSVVGVALILALGVIYYQRWWIRYRLFLLKLCFIGYEEIHDNVDRRDFQYDLAIMHHEADNEWVNQHLRPALAERAPDYNRIVCGDEELMLGMHYLDAVHYATEQSFKTIVVISREALQDQWFIMKFRTVLDHVNDTGTEKTVLVFVEDIPGEKLPFLIRLFLSDHRPYLVWPDNERGQDYFWEELIKDLTVNIRYCVKYSSNKQEESLTDILKRLEDETLEHVKTNNTK